MTPEEQAIRERCTCAVDTPGAPLCPMHERVLRPLSRETLASMVVDAEAALDVERAEVDRRLQEEREYQWGMAEMNEDHAVAAERARIHEAVEGLPTGVTMHTCWDNHDGPDGTHADGSACDDEFRQMVDRAAVLPAIEGSEK